jgi:energy-coupling factor transport system ATP-binding protein
MIKTDKLNFKYEDGKFELENIDIKIKDGEFVVIIGHNGSGKSTLAKLFNGIYLPTSGKIYVNKMDTSDEALIWEIRKSAGMIFQNPDNQIVATIVEDDVAFGPENLAIPRDEIRIRVDESLQIVGMYDYMMKPTTSLSGGQKQRVAIAGILAMHPKCIILDEPTAMLDPIGRKDVMRTIHKLNKEEKITIVHITHFMNEAVDADRIIVMDKGKIIMEGTPKEIFSRVDDVRNLGLDVPQITLLAHMLKNDGVDIEDDIIRIDEMVEKLCQLK